MISQAALFKLALATGFFFFPNEALNGIATYKTETLIIYSKLGLAPRVWKPSIFSCPCKNSLRDSGLLEENSVATTPEARQIKIFSTKKKKKNLPRFLKLQARVLAPHATPTSNEQSRGAVSEGQLSCWCITATKNPTGFMIISLSESVHANVKVSWHLGNAKMLSLSPSRIL